MVYTNPFIEKIKDTTPCFKTEYSYKALYNRFKNQGIHSQEELFILLAMLDDASLGLRLAAHHGDANNVSNIQYYIQFMAAKATEYLNGKALPEELHAKYPIENGASIRDYFLFKTSSNKNTALAWALFGASKKPVESKAEHAFCVAILLQAGFSIEHIPQEKRDESSCLYQFINQYRIYSHAHECLDFKTTYPAHAKPEELAPDDLREKCLHYLTAHFFMETHRKSLEKLATSLKISGIKKINIVEIGCGIPHQLMSVIRFFNANDINVTYLGFDTNNKIINEANLLYKNLPSNNKVVFMVKNGAELNDVEKYHGKIHLIIIRHPDITNPTTGDEFKNIMGTTAPLLINVENGLLLMSCYWDDEADLVNQHLRLQYYGASFSTKTSDFSMWPGGFALAAIENAPGKINAIYQPDKFALALLGTDLTCEHLAEYLKKKWS